MTSSRLTSMAAQTSRNDSRNEYRNSIEVGLEVWEAMHRRIATLESEARTLRDEIKKLERSLEQIRAVAIETLD